jgi:NAD(P)-dependent dehydrogenase (short-subunit alcohol dehydrogenase family)
MRYADPDQFEAVLRVNLLGSYRTIHATLPHVIERKGYVLQIASMAAVAAAPGMAAYCASKHGVEAMANSLRTEVKHLGVDVGCAYFSWIGTEMVYGADRRERLGAARKELKGPLGKTYPVSMAADAVVQGIEERRRIVTTPGWVRPLISLKPLVQRLTELGARSRMPEIDEQTRLEFEEKGAEAFTPTGLGGEAFTAADRARSRVEI